MYKFTKDCMIGIKQIDDEHQKLFAMLNDAIALTNETEDTEKIYKNLIKNLKEYAATHFSHEEAYMKEINDPELPTQIKEHQAFTEKVNNFTLDTSSKEAAKKSLNDLLIYLVQWLYRHILGSDIMIGKIKPATSEKNDPFAFTDKYKTGIELIDNEHNRLFDIIREANELIHAEILHDKYDEIIRILNELRNYTDTHFNDEEEFMEKINYPELEAQRKAHSAFINKLVNIDFAEFDEIDNNQQGYLLELIDYLLNWLTNHILGSDLKIGEYVRKTK